MNVRKVLLIEGTVNLFVMLSKLSIGLMTNSTAIIADAIHSLSPATVMPYCARPTLAMLPSVSSA